MSARSVHPVTSSIPRASIATMSEQAVEQAVALLTQGEIVALPTETVYGLAGCALDPIAVAKIFEAKERPHFDPLIVHLPNKEWLPKVTLPFSNPHQTKVLEALIDKFWPGPLTILLPRNREVIPDLVTAGSPSVAVRLSAHPAFAAVVQAFGSPLAAPSANRFGRISPTTAAHVVEELGERIPFVLDDGPTPHGVESTIVSIEETAGSEVAVRILRNGPITAEMLSSAVDCPIVERDFEDSFVTAFTDVGAAAPGQLPSHYAPQTPVTILKTGQSKEKTSGACGLLAFRKDQPPRDVAEYDAVEFLSDDGDLRQAASRLFAALRELDHANVKRIFVEEVPKDGLGKAIMERLKRAEAKRPVETSPPVNTKTAAGVVGIAVMCSRVLGLIRDQTFAYLFGAGSGMDAFLTAFRAPNLLRDLFAEGALSTAFVTTFSKKIATEGDASAWRLANKMASLTVIFMSLVSILGIIFAPQLIAILGGGFSPEKVELTVTLTRVMYPFILLVSLAALVMGMLNAKHVFGMPAMASSFFNLGSIIGGVGIGWYLDPHFGTRALMGLAIGTLIGGFLQFVVQLPALWKAGYHFHFDLQWRDKGVADILRLMGPAVIAASAVQINVLVNASFASFQGDGAITWLSFAFRLMQLPLGVFGVAIATVTLPLVSRCAALGNTTEFRSTLAQAMRLAFFLTIPSAVGLICLAQPIIGLLFERGRFSHNSTIQTAGALQFYALGLAGYAGIKVLAPAFYALDARKTPMVVSFIAIGVNVILNLFFSTTLGWGHRGLALSTSITAIINFCLLYFLMRQKVRRLETIAFTRILVKLLVASAVLAAVCWFGTTVLLQNYFHEPAVTKTLLLFTVIIAASASFFATCYVLRIEEMRQIVDIFRKRFQRLMK